MGGFFGDQMGGVNNVNNIFSQFGNMGGQMNSNFFVNNQNSSNTQNEQFTQNEAEQNQEYNNSEEEDEENQEELEKRYIELRNSVINQLPRFKFGTYKSINKNKEVHE